MQDQYISCELLQSKYNDILEDPYREMQYFSGTCNLNYILKGSGGALCAVIYCNISTFSQKVDRFLNVTIKKTNEQKSCSCSFSDTEPFCNAIRNLKKKSQVFLCFGNLTATLLYYYS